MVPGGMWLNSQILRKICPGTARISDTDSGAERSLFVVAQASPLQNTRSSMLGTVLDFGEEGGV
jgi:hypothetical protein